jgi:heme/copper-type cytochrome/quinol oxidase subunit 2
MNDGGLFYWECSERCGVRHRLMPIVVGRALDPRIDFKIQTLFAEP